MSKIKSTNTIPELVLRKRLWQKGLRYRIHNKSLCGNPDISIKKYKLAIFIDGEFWHGYNWENKKNKIKANRDYWVKKIEGNIERDKKINEYYCNNGWKVFRFWEHKLKVSLESCANEILQFIDRI